LSPVFHLLFHNPSLLQIREALKELRVIFPSLILNAQDLFATEAGYEELLKVIPDPAIAKSLRSKWEDNPSSPSDVKWADLLKIANSNNNKVRLIYSCF
jgi:DNA primase small subunit